MALTVSRSPTAPTALTLSSKNNPSLRYLYLNQRHYYFVWLYEVLEIYIFITLWIPVLYHNNLPYYPNRNQGIELFVASIIIIVTGIYDSRWRVFSRPRLPAIARKYSEYRLINSLFVRDIAFSKRVIIDIYVNLYFYEYGLRRWH